MLQLSHAVPMRPMRSGMTKTQLVEALQRAEARSIRLAAENDRLRHALEIEKANNQFQDLRAKMS